MKFYIYKMCLKYLFRAAIEKAVEGKEIFSSYLQVS